MVLLLDHLEEVEHSTVRRTAKAMLQVSGIGLGAQVHYGTHCYISVPSKIAVMQHSDLQYNMRCSKVAGPEITEFRRQ